MITAISYIKKEKEIMICRCYGEGTVLQLPDHLDNLPVTALADHCFAKDASFKLRHTPKELAMYVPESDVFVPLTEPDPELVKELTAHALCALEPEEIFLPSTMKRLEEYAFYGCNHLLRLHVPHSMEKMGGGVFVACNHIEQLIFYRTTEPMTASCLREVVSELSYELEVLSEDADGQEEYRLVFPEYIEETIENTPARIIEMRYEGTGFRYRQCFAGGEPDVTRYDSIFHEACMTEYPATMLRLSLCRLCSPFGLTKVWTEQYLTYLNTNYRETAAYLIRHLREDMLNMLCTRDYFTRELLDYFLEEVSKASWAEAVSILMDHRRKKFPAKKKKYDFDF